MLGLETINRHRRFSPEIISRCTVSSIFGIITQFALFTIPNYFGSFSLLFQLILSVLVMFVATIFGQFVRRFAGVRASAPAFVFFHIIFIWSIYINVIRQAVSSLMNILFNGMFAFLLIGFFRMLMSDPGFVCCDSPGFPPVSEDSAHIEEHIFSETGRRLRNSTEEASFSAWRVRYCRSCKVYVRGFDHHCPAFGNCIGQKNHVLFLVLLVGFILTEAAYALFAYQWTERNEHQASGTEIYKSFVKSTMIFSLVQVLWQVAFLIWHVHCVCFNIRTNEWINWRQYPEFHIVVQSSESSSKMRFVNPYHKGVFSNLKDFLQMWDSSL